MYEVVLYCEHDKCGRKTHILVSELSNPKEPVTCPGCYTDQTNYITVDEHRKHVKEGILF